MSNLQLWSFQRRWAGLAAPWIGAAFLFALLALESPGQATTPILYGSPSNQSVRDGADASFTAYFDNSASPTVQWEMRADSSAPWQPVAGGDPSWNSSTLRVARVDLSMSGRQYRCVLTFSAGTESSNPATLTVTPSAPWFRTAPQTQYVAVGQTAVFTADVAGTPPLSMVWVKDGHTISGATDTTLTIANAQPSDAGIYRLAVSNSLGPVSPQNSPSLVVVQPPVITDFSQDQAVALGGSAYIGLSITSNGPTTVRWFHDGVLLSSVYNSWIQFNSVTAADAGTYVAEVSNAAGTVTSRPLLLTVYSAPPSGVIVRNAQVSLGGATTLTADYYGPTSTNPRAYQWYHDGTPIPGAQTSQYSIPNATLSDLGDYYALITADDRKILTETVRVELSVRTTPLSHEWIDATESGGIAYFLFASPARIARYDLVQRMWLNSWTLPATPVAFARATDAWYVANATTVVKYDTTLANGTTLLTAPAPISQMGLIGEHLIVSCSGSYQWNYRSHDRNTGTLISQVNSTNGPVRAFNYNSTQRKVFGASSRQSGGELCALIVSPTGTVSSPWPTTFPDPQVPLARTFSLNSETLLVSTSGLAIDIATGASLANFGRRLDDVVEDGTGGYYGLRQGKAVRWDSSFRELASLPLDRVYQRAWLRGTTLLCFAQPTASGENPVIRAVEVATLAAPVAAPAVDPHGLALYSPQVSTDGNDIVYLYSKVHRNVLRWSASQREFLGSVALTSSPNSVVVLPEAGSLLYEHTPNQIRRLPIVGSTSSAPFASSPGYARGLYSAGQFLVVASRRDDSNSDHSQFVFDSSGHVVSAREGRYYSVSTDWSPLLRQLYHFRSDITPPNLLRISIDEAGLLSDPTPAESPYHTESLGATPPLCVDPAGEFVAAGGGAVFETGKLTLVQTFPLKFTGLAWANRRLYTIRDTVAGCIVEAWTRGTWGLVASLPMPGRAVSLQVMRGDRLLVITEQGNVPTFTFLRSDTLAAENPADSAPLTIREKSPDATAVVGQAFTAWVVTSGGELPSYQWQMRRAGSSVWEDLADSATIRGARGGTLQISSVDAALAGARFRVQIANSSGTAISDESAVAIAGQASIVDLAAGDNHLLFLRADGSAWIYPPNTSDSALASSPRLVAQSITGISAGYGHSGFLRRDGIYLTGSNEPAPAPVPTAIKSAADYSGSLWLLRDGTVIGGSGNEPLASGATDIAVSLSGAFCVTADGALMSVASGRAPQPLLADVLSVSANPQSYVVLALKRDRSLWNTLVAGGPQKLADDVIDAAVGSQHVIYATSNGDVWVISRNIQTGELNQTSVKIATGAVRVASTCMLRADGSLVLFSGLTGGSTNVTLNVIARGLPPLSAPLSGAVSATAIAEGVALSWNPTILASRWEIWRGTQVDGSDAARIATTGPLPNYIDASAIAGARYYYWVRTASGPVAGSSAGIAGERGSPTLPVITQQPTRTAFAVTLSAVGKPVPSYQWEYRSAGNTTWARATSTGNQTATLSTDALSYLPTGSQIRCVVSNAAGAVNSEAISVEDLSYTEPLRFTSHPSSMSPRVGQYVSFTGSTFGGGATIIEYQWIKNGTEVPGATSTSLVIDRLDFTHAGTYQLRARAGSTEILSNSATLTVVPAMPAFALAAADNHTLFVAANGALYVTGSNRFGQLFRTSTAPDWFVDGPGTADSSNPAVVATGRTHSIRLDSYGSYSVGDSTYGQTFRYASYSGYERMIAVAAGGSHTIALDAKGNAWAVGRNHVGQLGDLTTTNRTTPTKVMTGIRFVAASENNSFFVDAAGTLWGVGASDEGQLGANPAAPGTPTAIATDVVRVVAASRYVTFIKSDGTLWVLGTNAGGICGADVALDAVVTTPRQIASGVVRVAAGDSHLAFIKNDASLWTVGANTRGQLGTGDTTPHTESVSVASHATAVACGAAHTVFIDDAGAVWGCGANADHQLGLQSNGADVLLPQRIWMTEPAAVPATPSDVKVTPSTSPAGLVLTWSPQRDAQSYQVLRNTVADLATATPLTTDTTVTGFLDYTASANTTYYYWVRAVSFAGVSPASPHLAGRHSGASNLPVITSQPSASTAYFGSALAMSVSATSNAGTLIYQWRRNGVALPGGLTTSSSTTLIDKLLDSDAGDYDVVVSNSAGSVVSNAVRVTIAPPWSSLTFQAVGDRAFTNAPITLVGTSSAGITPTFEVVSGPAEINGNQLRLTATGTVVLRASHPGNTNYAPQSTTQSFQVSRAVVPLQLSQLTQRFDGQPKPASVTGLPEGVTVRLSYDGGSTPPTAVGRYTVTAEVETPNFLGAQTGILTILPGVQTISFTLPGHIYGPLNLLATSNTATPVNFAVASGPATLTAARLVPTGLGAVTVSAFQAGTANYDAAVVMRTTEVLFGFPSWQALHFSTAELDHPEVIGPEADPDADGLNNLLEYALGLDPRQVSAEWNTMRCETGDWVFTYSRPSERSDLIYTVETSSSLQTWSTDNLAHTRVTTSDGIETWEARRPVSAGSTSFFRLKISRQ